MKVFGSLASIRVDAVATRASIDAELRAIFHDATREWVRTIIRIVPSWSGMSRASVRKIADKVGEAVFDNPVNGTDRHGRIRKAPDRRQQGFNQAHAIFVDKGPIYFFEWQSIVEHFLFNELNNANAFGFHLRKPGPYHSQKIAADAFTRIVDSRLRGFKIAKHIKYNVKTIGV